MHNSYDEELGIGDRIAGRYEILSILGQGSMGVVYKCRHDILGRVVAIKTLRIQRNTDDRSQMRFEREARAASRLEHSNLITVHDFGYTAQGIPYLVMDFVSGFPLYDLLKKERYLVPERAVNIFSEVCDGLYHAHQRGVIHRDLKPANILVVPREGMAETIKIVDLGVAKIVHGAEEESEAITRTGEVCGSPIYLSPEQCMYQELDARTDIYSLGVCMYESLTGGPPLRGATVYDTIYMHVHDQPRPFPPEMKIPRKLEEVVFRCLAKSPNDRYETMLQLKSELLASIRSGPELSSVNVLPPDALFPRSGANLRPTSEQPKPAKPALDPSAPSAVPQSRGEQAARAAASESRGEQAARAASSDAAKAEARFEQPSLDELCKPESKKKPTLEQRRAAESGKHKAAESGKHKAADSGKHKAVPAQNVEQDDSDAEMKPVSSLAAKRASSRAGDKSSASGKGGFSAMPKSRLTLLCLSVASILIGLGLGLGFAVYVMNDQKSSSPKTASELPSVFDDKPIASDDGISAGKAGNTKSSKGNKKQGGSKKGKNTAPKSLLASNTSAGKSKNLEDYLDGPKDGSASKYFSIVQKPGVQRTPRSTAFMNQGGSMLNQPLLSRSGMQQGGMQQGGMQQGGMPQLAMQPGMTQARPLTANNGKLQQAIMRFQNDARFQQVKQLLASQGVGAGAGPAQGMPSIPAMGGLPQDGMRSGGNTGPLGDFNAGDSTTNAADAAHEGFQFYADGNYEGACRKFEQASRLAPQQPEYKAAYAQALNAYASQLNKQGKYAEAVHVEKKAISLAPDKSMYHQNLYKFEQNRDNQRSGLMAP